MISRFLPLRVRQLLGVKVTSSPPAYKLLDQPGTLDPLLAGLERVKEVSIDTEADNMFHFKTRMCLIQLLVGKEVYLVDVLAPGLKLDRLWASLATKHLVMHGSDFDLRLLHDFCRFRPKSIFDTMLAAQLLNRQRIGLAPLLEEHFGVKLSKDSQKANWSKRPLTQKMLDYASLDVWHLPALRDILTKELIKLKRFDWLEQQCAAQIDSGSNGFAPPDENDWRIGRSERLRGKGLGVLHAIWHWRQQTAEKIDVPPFKVCNNDLLIRIAEAAEMGDSVESILGHVNLGRRHERLAPSLAAAITTGVERDPTSLPRRRGRDSGQSALTQSEIALQDRIKADRDRVAAQLQLDPTLIANRAQLSQIARKPGQLDEILLPWQASLLRDEPALKQA